MKKIIGITGGIASGKSYVCSVVSSCGYPVIDSDKISYELSQRGKPIYEAIVSRFGKEYLNNNSEIDRKKLGRLIFNDESSKIALNEISHPLIVEEIKRQINNTENNLVFVDIPLLYEAGLEYLCDCVICVYLNRDDQISRLMQRDGIDREYAVAKINSQMDLSLKKKKADFVIDSIGNFDNTRIQVEKIIELIKGE